MVATGLGGPDLQAEEADDLGIAVVATVGVDEKGVEEVRAGRMDLAKDVVLVALPGVLEGIAVARVTSGGDGAEAFEKQPPLRWIAADGLLDVRDHAESSARGKSRAGRKDAIQHLAQQAAISLDEGAHPRRASSVKRSAMYSASAWIVEVGFTAPPVTRMLPSTT